MSGDDERTRVSWLTEACPPWCTREHAEGDHPEDRYHQSEPSILTVVAGPGDAVPVTASLRPTTLALRAGRHLDDDLTWVVIESLEEPLPRLVLTADAARDLARALREQLTELAGR